MTIYLIYEKLRLTSGQTSGIGKVVEAWKTARLANQRVEELNAEFPRSRGFFAELIEVKGRRGR
jgi:hypothetical protein